MPCCGGTSGRRSTWLGGCFSQLPFPWCSVSPRAGKLRPWTFTIPQIAINALLAVVITSAWGTWKNERASWREAVPKAAAALLAFVWLAVPVHAHLTSMRDTKNLRRHGSPGAMRARFPEEVRRAISRETELIVFLRSPNHVLPRDFLRFWCGIDAGPNLKTLTLSDNAQVPLDDLVMTRTGPRSMRLSCSEPFTRANDFYRFDDRYPLQTGQTISLAGVTVKVEEVLEWQGLRGTAPLQRLRSAEFTLAEPLDSEGTLLLTWSEGRFEQVTPPPIGQSIELR